ncbi:response regulator transcription factor [Idiomarina aquatica]|uniref:response regulator transcription factor n=1 Tax=Idiomarina aquatica TaxID=1327752 RepID=UPI001414E108|nr:response regulator transcription factor [Idiomarina aquatica]
MREVPTKAGVVFNAHRLFYTLGAGYAEREQSVVLAPEAQATYAGSTTEEVVVIEKSILVVEDDTVLRELLEYLLQREGYQVASCADGAQAQERLQQQLPDLVLLDLQLPIVSGNELIAWLRANSDSAALPILVLTSLQDEDDIAAALDAGADDYMVKPFQPKELQARLRKLLKIRPQAKRTS